jgi:hypothetical protein
VFIPDDGGPEPLYSTYVVGFDTLKDFIAFMDKELNGSLDRGIDRIQGDSPYGQDLVAGLMGHKIGRTRYNYLHGQQYALDNLARYMLTGLAMLEVIDHLLKIYRNAEDLAAVSTEDLKGFLSGVYREKEAAWREATRPRDASGNYMDL